MSTIDRAIIRVNGDPAVAKSGGTRAWNGVLRLLLLALVVIYGVIFVLRAISSQTELKQLGIQQQQATAVVQETTTQQSQNTSAVQQAAKQTQQ